MRGSQKIAWIGVFICAVAACFWAVNRRSAHDSGAKAPPIAPAVTAGDSQGQTPADPTAKDAIVDGPFIKEFTTEQQAKLDAMRKEFGELQSKIEIADREVDNVRALSVGLPGIKEHVEALKAARAEMQAAVAKLPQRLDAEAKLRAAEPPASSASSRFAGFSAHVLEHLKKPADPATECDWCRRDASRIEARDPRLGRDYKVEGEALLTAVNETAESLRKARIELSRIVRTAASLPELQPLAERAQAEQKSVDAMMATLPELAALRAEAQTARQRQNELKIGMSEIYKAARVVLPSVAHRPDAGDEKASTP